MKLEATFSESHLTRLGDGGGMMGLFGGGLRTVSGFLNGTEAVCTPPTKIGSNHIDTQLYAIPSKSTRTTWKSLPEDVLSCIIQFLPTNEVSKLGATNRFNWTFIGTSIHAAMYWDEAIRRDFLGQSVSSKPNLLPTLAREVTKSNHTFTSSTPATPGSARVSKSPRQSDASNKCHQYRLLYIDLHMRHAIREFRHACLLAPYYQSLALYRNQQEKVNTADFEVGSGDIVSAGGEGGGSGSGSTGLVYTLPSSLLQWVRGGHSNNNNATGSYAGDGIVGMLCDIIWTDSELLSYTLSRKRSMAMSTIIAVTDRHVREFRTVSQKKWTTPNAYLSISVVQRSDGGIPTTEDLLRVYDCDRALLDTSAVHYDEVYNISSSTNITNIGSGTNTTRVPAPTTVPPPTCIPGFLGYALALLHLRPEHECLRYNILWTIFRDLMVFDTVANKEAFCTRVARARARALWEVGTDEGTGAATEEGSIWAADGNAAATTSSTLASSSSSRISPADSVVRMLAAAPGGRVYAVALDEYHPSIISSTSVVTAQGPGRGVAAPQDQWYLWNVQPAVPAADGDKTRPPATEEMTIAAPSTVQINEAAAAAAAPAPVPPTTAPPAAFPRASTTTYSITNHIAAAFATASASVAAASTGGTSTNATSASSLATTLGNYVTFNAPPTTQQLSQHSHHNQFTATAPAHQQQHQPLPHGMASAPRRISADIHPYMTHGHCRDGSLMRSSGSQRSVQSPGRGLGRSSWTDGFGSSGGSGSGSGVLSINAYLTYHHTRVVRCQESLKALCR